MVWWEKALAALLALVAAYAIGVALWPAIYAAGVRAETAMEHWHENTIEGHLERLDHRVGKAEADIAALKGDGGQQDYERLEGSVVVRPRRQVSVQHLPGGGVKIQLPH